MMEKETQETITNWGIETFGYGTALGSAARMNVEVQELLSDLQSANDPLLDELLKASAAMAEAICARVHHLEEAGYFRIATQGQGKECCDIGIILYQVADRCGINLDPAMDDKMQVNRNRQWKKLANGRNQHV